MKKYIKIPLIIIGSILLLLILISLIAPPIARNYIEKNSKELVGRSIGIEKIRLNTFTGSVKIIGFDMKEADNVASFFKFDTLHVKVKLLDFLRHRITVKQIHLSDAALSVYQQGSRFNFDDIIQKFTSTDTTAVDTAATSSSWAIGLYDIRLRRSSIVYRDLLVKSEFDLQDLNLDIPGVYFSDKSTDMGLNLIFANGGTLQSELSYDIAKSAFDIHLILDKFSINGITPYLQESFRIGSINGYFNTNIHITGDVEHIMDTSLQGNISIDSLSVTNDRNQHVITAMHIGADMENVVANTSQIKLNKLVVDGVHTGFSLEKDGSDNFSYLIKDTAGDSTSNETPPANATENNEENMNLVIKKLSLSDLNLDFQDKSLQEPFLYSLKNISVQADNFDYNEKNSVHIKGNVGSTGTTEIKWDGSLHDFSNQNIAVTLRNVNLKEFTPYSLQYFAYPITNGNFTFISHNIIKNNYLNGNNIVDIFKSEMGKARKDIKSEYNIPMRTVLYILKDKNDKINIQLPVKGNIDSPEFSYKKIIINTFINLIVKVAAAPVSFLSNSLGISGNDNSKIEFSSLYNSFTSEQYGKLDQLADIITAKPELVLEIKQDINYTDTYTQLAVANLKRDFYLSQNKDRTVESLELIDYESIHALSNQDSLLNKFADTTLLKQNLTGKDIYEKSMLLYKNMLQQQVDTLAANRNQLIKEYLVTRRNVPPANVNIETIPYDPAKSYSGKNYFRVNLILKEEQE